MPSSSPHRVREGRCVGEAEPLERARSLHRDEPVLVGGVAHLAAARLALLQPVVDGCAIRRIDDEVELPVAEPVRDEVVDDPARVVREQRVLRLAVLEPVDVVREHRLEELLRRRAVDVDLAHVRDVEGAGVRDERPCARESRPRTARASRSRRREPCAHRAPRGARRAACAGASRPRTATLAANPRPVGWWCCCSDRGRVSVRGFRDLPAIGSSHSRTSDLAEWSVLFQEGRDVDLDVAHARRVERAAAPTTTPSHPPAARRPGACAGARRTPSRSRSPAPRRPSTRR